MSPMTRDFRTIFKHLATMAITLDEKKQKNNKINKRFWVQDILKRNTFEGEFYTLRAYL